MSMRCFKCADDITISGVGSFVAAIYNDMGKLERDGYVKTNRHDQYGWDVYELRDWTFVNGKFEKVVYPYHIEMYKYALYAPL